jgi:hypothetical protein
MLRRPWRDSCAAVPAAVLAENWKHANACNRSIDRSIHPSIIHTSINKSIHQSIHQSSNPSFNQSMAPCPNFDL